MTFYKPQGKPILKTLGAFSHCIRVKKNRPFHNIVPSDKNSGLLCCDAAGDP
jgi:hypothetical protein